MRPLRLYRITYCDDQGCHCSVEIRASNVGEAIHLWQMSRPYSETWQNSTNEPDVIDVRLI